MNSTTLICKRCKAPLEYEDGSSKATCPCCGYSELIDETDKVKLERIRTNAYKDTELGKQQIAKEAQIAEKKLGLEDKKLGIKKIKVILFTALTPLVIAFAIYLGYKIKHMNEVRIPLDSSDYCQRDYNETKALLEDAGFSEIELVVQETLSKNEQKYENIVTQVSVNGSVVFKAKTWFPKKSAVKITYCVLDPSKANDIEIPIAAVDCLGKNYKYIEDKLTEAGFKNVKSEGYPDLDKKTQEEEGKITEILVDGQKEFHLGDFFGESVAIRIVYHTMDPERMDDVKIPNDYSDYVKKDYVEACEEFRQEGFRNITLIPKYDIGFLDGSKNGIIQSISIGDSDRFYKGDWVAPDTLVKINFRTKEFKYIGENYQEIEKALANLGFSNINCEGLNDLEVSELKKAGIVESVLVDGIEYKDATELNTLRPIVIKYHSERKASATQVKVPVDSKKLVGEKANTVISQLKEMGFTNITAKPLEDLSKDGNKNEKVTEISVGGVTKFSAGEIFEKNADVVVSYHSVKAEEEAQAVEVTESQVAISVSSKELSGKDVQEVFDTLTNMGFTNITKTALGDLKKGWFHKEGEVKEISIAGKTKFAVNDVFDKDSEVVITYHSYPN